MDTQNNDRSHDGPEVIGAPRAHAREAIRAVLIDGALIARCRIDGTPYADAQADAILQAFPQLREAVPDDRSSVRPFDDGDPAMDPARDRPLCATCTNWCTLDLGTEGQCRLNAPLVTGSLHGPEQTLWPVTDEADWCGQHSELGLRIEGALEKLANPVIHYRPGETRMDAAVDSYQRQLAVEGAAQKLGATKGDYGHWVVPGVKAQLTDNQLVIAACDDCGEVVP